MLEIRVRVDQESDQGGKFFSCYLIVLAIGCNNAPPVPLPNQPVPIRFFVGVDPSGAPTKSAGAYTETLQLTYPANASLSQLETVHVWSAPPAVG
jgi:hypothetical protein